MPFMPLLCGADISDALGAQTSENGNRVSPPVSDDRSMIVDGEFDAGEIASFLNERIHAREGAPFSAAHGLMDDLNAERAARKIDGAALCDRLFEAIKHGDEDHRQWLRVKLNEFFTDYERTTACFSPAEPKI